VELRINCHKTLQQSACVCAHAKCGANFGGETTVDTAPVLMPLWLWHVTWPPPCKRNVSDNSRQKMRGSSGRSYRADAAVAAVCAVAIHDNNVTCSSSWFAVGGFKGV